MNTDRELPALRVQQIQRCLSLVLARPDRRNVLNRELLDALHESLDIVETDSNISLVTLSAEGPFFCEGMDFAQALTTTAGNPEAMLRQAVGRFHDLLVRLTRIPVIVAAIVEGRVNAGGMGLMAASDLVLARPQADFGLSEILFGLLPATVSPFLVRRTGFQATYRMALTGQRMDATRAQSCGLVDELVDDPTDAVRRLRLRADRLARPAVARMKAFYADTTGADRRQAEDALVALLADKDIGKGLQGFLQENTPSWRTQ